MIIQLKLFYKKKFLPVLVQDSSDNFRKIRDHENNQGGFIFHNYQKKRLLLL